MRNLEAGSIRSTAESAGGCAKLKTVTEIRRNNAHETFIADSVYLELNSFLDQEPVERLKHRSEVTNLKQNEAQSARAESTNNGVN